MRAHDRLSYLHKEWRISIEKIDNILSSCVIDIKIEEDGDFIIKSLY